MRIRIPFIALNAKRRIAVFFGIATGIFTLSILVMTNTGGLRTSLFLDTKVHLVAFPHDSQIVQVSPSNHVEIPIVGRVGLRASRVEIAATSRATQVSRENAWATLDAAPRLTHYSGRISLSNGWHRIYLRSFGSGGYRLANDILLGVGEVFIVAGQSNAAGGDGSLFSALSGHVKSGQVQENGALLWRQANDPQVRGGGSVWPLVGDDLAERLKVPIGFINVASGGSSILDWQPGKPAFKQIADVLRQTQPHFVRAILWHQGETDKNRGMIAHEYFTALKRLIQGIREETGFKGPWVVAQTSYSDGTVGEGVRHAQALSWREGLALPGPDTDTLGAAFRDAEFRVHFNESGTRKAARLWSDSIMTCLFVTNRPTQRP
jgi:hypothetical protein